MKVFPKDFCPSVFDKNVSPESVLADVLQEETKELSNSSSLRPGFEGCSQMINDPLYLRFVYLEQDEIFAEHKTRCFLLP